MGLSNVVLNFGSNKIYKVVNARIGGRTKQKAYGEARLGKGENIYYAEEGRTITTSRVSGYVHAESAHKDYGA